ncbi:MAG: IscS subfamily cysteine desulfurase [Ginsengibacter sp.]
MVNLPVYLDNNATTQMDEEVLEFMLPYFTQYYGNAASHSHSYGWQAEEAVELAREKVAKLINAETKEIIFTSGATESINLALKGIFEMYAAKGNHIITVKTEHKAVLDTCTHIEKSGGEITLLPVNDDGLIDLADLEKAIKPQTIIIAVMYANNETGLIQPIKEIGKIARKHGILFFCDATQAIGKIPVNVLDDNIDIMSFSAHKIYGPKGVGALYVRRRDPRVRLIAQIDGGGHERGMRSGTLNVPGIAGFGKACELCLLHLLKEGERIKSLRDKLECAIIESGLALVNGSIKNRLPNTSNLQFKHKLGDILISKISKYLAVSSGSACTSATLEPSYVLQAMDVEKEDARSSIRFSLGRFTTEEEINFTIQIVNDVATQLYYEAEKKSKVTI